MNEDTFEYYCIQGKTVDHRRQGWSLSSK
jgi:hypothetical protein